MFFSSELQHGEALAADVVVVALDEAIHRSLSALAAARGWPLLLMTSAEEALLAICRLGARVVVVQVSRAADQVLRLISAARQESRRLIVVATAVRHDDELERTLRRNGADYYVWLGQDASLLAELVEACARRSGAIAGAQSAARPSRNTDQT